MTSSSPINVTTWSTTDVDPDVATTTARAVAMSLVAGIVIVVTVIGNLLVAVSFGVDCRLRTVSNYFLLSLSVADLSIGLVSMPLYTVYVLLGRWPLGQVVCDLWLSLDYTTSNASVASLLLISFDRYLSLTRPLSYRVRRTSRKASVAIVIAWVVSAALWSPWILAWPYFDGERTVPRDRVRKNPLSSIPSPVFRYCRCILCCIHIR